MHGVMLLCSRTGTLLYSQAYSKNFGLPHAAAAASGGGSNGVVDELRLSSMLFALYINSASVVVPAFPTAVTAGGASDGHDMVGALRLFDVGQTTMHFAHHASARLLGVVLAESSLGEQIGRHLAETITARFAAKYFPDGPTTDVPRSGGPPTPMRRVRGVSKSVLHAVFQELPQRIMEEALIELSGPDSEGKQNEMKVDWVFGLLSKPFADEMDWDDFVKGERHAGQPHSGGPRRRPDVPKMAFRPKPQKTKRWWNGGTGTKVKSASTMAETRPDPRDEYVFARLGPLQYLYHRPDDVLAALRPTEAFFESLVTVIHKAGKVLSSVAAISDRLASLEVQLHHTPNNDEAEPRTITITVLRVGDFFVAFPTATPGQPSVVVSRLYQEFDRLRLWLVLPQAPTFPCRHWDSSDH